MDGEDSESEDSCAAFFENEDLEEERATQTPIVPP